MQNPTINNNYFPATIFFDLAVNYRLIFGPSVVAYSSYPRTVRTRSAADHGSEEHYWKGQVNAAYYDRVGQTFRLGLRFKM